MWPDNKINFRFQFETYLERNSNKFPFGTWVKFNCTWIRWQKVNRRKKDNIYLLNSNSKLGFFIIWQKEVSQHRLMLTNWSLKIPRDVIGAPVELLHPHQLKSLSKKFFQKLYFIEWENFRLNGHLIVESHQSEKTQFYTCCSESTTFTHEMLRTKGNRTP